MNRSVISVKEPDRKQGDELEMKNGNAVDRTRGIIKIEPVQGTEIAESDELSGQES
jgi:hypothetical protein